MATKTGNCVYHLACLLVILHIYVVLANEVIYEDKKPCTYFESERVATSEMGLVNCSWYSAECCCKRTEVTSVFGNMMPLFGATKVCRNMINYMMCYFCSPDQAIWYKKKVTICEEFCLTVYDECKTAAHGGKEIGEAYTNGTSFCEAQNFDVVSGKSKCFDFDPNVFGSALCLTPLWIQICSATLFIVLCFNRS